MPSDTASTSSRVTIPISPTFSTDTTSSAPLSEATTDEAPDLGAFTQILWAWNNLQPAPRQPVPQFHPPPSSRSSHTLNDHPSISSFTHPGLSEASGTESVGPEEAAETVWTQHQLQSYFSLNSITPSTRVHELDENEYDINIVNNYPDQGYEEPEQLLPPSPFSDGSQTVEIYEATSDFDIPETVSLHESVDHSPHRRPMAVPVMGLSSTRRGSGALSSRSGAERDASLTSRGGPPLRGSPFSTNLFNTERQVVPLRRHGSPDGMSVHITPRQADFPIHDHSSLYSQSTARLNGTRPSKTEWPQTQPKQVSGSPRSVLIDDTSSMSSYPTQGDSEDAVQSLLNQARVARSIINDNSVCHSIDSPDTLSIGTGSYNPFTPHSTPYYGRDLDSAPRATPPRPIQTRIFSPQVELPSPLATPQDSEVLVYSPRQHHLKVELVDEDQSLTPTRPPARSFGHSLPQQMAGSDRYLTQGISHPYPHPLKGIHGLPVEIAPSEPQAEPIGRATHIEDDSAGERSESDFDGDQPSLGLLDEALSFIAAERARYEALRPTGGHPADEGSTPPEWQHIVDTSVANAKRKRRKKAATTVKPQDDAFLATPNTRPLLLATNPDNALFESDHDVLEATTTNILHGTNNKRITILTRPKPHVTPPSAPITIEEPLRLTGKQGKRVGRREREREKARRDKERAALEAAEPERPVRGEGADDWEAEGGRDEGDDDVDGEDEDGVEDGAEGDLGVSSSEGSAPNAHAAHASAGTRAFIHQAGSGKGVYKSTPASPRAVSPDITALGVQESGGLAKDSEQDMEEPLVIIPPVKVVRGRKKPKKRVKTLEHAKSYPNLRQDPLLDPEGPEALSRRPPLLDQGKRTRLVDLVHRLEVAFPEQSKDLKKVTQRLEGAARRKGGLTRTASTGSGKGRSKHIRNGSEGTISIQDNSTGVPEQDPVELEVIGRIPPPDDSGPLIHVFIDHSNILIGLLNSLKRSPPPKEIVANYLASRAVQSADSLPGKTSTSNPITIPASKKRVNGPLIEESPAEGTFEYPIPLPSFATAKAKQPSMSKSLPTESALDAHMSKRGARKTVAHGVVSDASEEQEGEEGRSPNVEKKAIRFPRHLWHAALVLVLERGRAISRRVVVTSSPLYQPMEDIQTLGYEVRVYMRVPNLGDGMDQERKKARYAAASRSIHNAKGSPSKKTHMRQVSGSTSAESGSGTRLNSPAYTPSLTTQIASANAAPGAKIKYREQGVDELLQLKLHQALADVDVVPVGSTIVLATGDGNVGQFNEDGFLGPVRTALKRGWKVELYAWEDGLSRSWRREFGENSEWGKKGLFRIIPLEPFATSLLEAAGW